MKYELLGKQIDKTNLTFFDVDYANYEQCLQWLENEEEEFTLSVWKTERFGNLQRSNAKSTTTLWIGENTNRLMIKEESQNPKSKIQNRNCRKRFSRFDARFAAERKRARNRVTVYESAPEIGGLASAWQIGDVVWDKHYHVTLLSDSFTRKIVEEIGLGGRV